MAELALKKYSLEDLLKDEVLLGFIRGEASIFQQPEFLNAVGTDLVTHVVQEGEHITGALSVVKVKKAGITGYHRPPYAHLYGPVIGSAYKTKGGQITELLLSNLENTALTEFKLRLEDQDLIPYLQSGASVLAAQGHLLSSGSNYSESAIHNSKRRYLKKLLKAVDNGELMVEAGKSTHDRLIWLQGQTAEQNGFRSYADVLARIMSSLQEDQYYSFLITSKNGDPLAGAFCPYDQRYAYHLVNASMRHEDGLYNRANILSTYLSVEKAISMGLGFDFEGSNVPGVASFYRMMGGQPRILYRLQFHHNLKGRMFLAARQF